MILEIKDVDYSQYVLTDGYAVNSTDVTVEFTDALYRVHKKIVRKKVKGTLNLLFRSPQAYSDFVSHVKSSKNSVTGLTYCKVRVNNINELVAGLFYLTFTPERTRRGDGVEVMKSFKLTLEEQ